MEVSIVWQSRLQSMGMCEYNLHCWLMVYQLLQLFLESGYSSDSCSEVPTTPLTVEMEDFEDMDIDEDAPNESDYDVTEEEPEDDEDSYIGQTDTDTDTDTDDEIHIDSK